MQFNPPPSPSTPPALALPSAPSSPLSLATAGTPTSSSSLGSLLQLPSSQAAGAEEEGNPVDSAAKQWEATVDDETLRITLRTAKYNHRSRSRSTTPAKRPLPSPGPRQMSSSDEKPQPLTDTAQPASPTPSASSSTSTSTASSSPHSPAAHNAASSSRRLPWTSTELSALIQGVAKYGKDWTAIMRDEKLGRLLRRRTVVACRKQYMFGRAMGQWRKGTRELPGLRREPDREEEEESEEEEAKTVEEKEGNERRDEKDEPMMQDDTAGAEPFVHATRARTRGATRPKPVKEEQKAAADDESESDDDEDMSDDTDTADQPSRSQPWSNVRADELPPGKRRSEYRRCRHTCGCKGRTSGDKRAVVNKHGRRNHEKSESQHPDCDRRYTCHRLFGNLKQNGEEELLEEEEEDEEEESEWSEAEEEEEDETEQPQYAMHTVPAAAMGDDSTRPVFGAPFPLPAAPPLYRPSSVLAHSGATSAPSLYTPTTAPAGGTRMAVVQSLLDLGPSATQQRQVSAARATEWMRWKDDSERYEEMIRSLRTQLATLMERDAEWHRKEAAWRSEKEELKARVKELEAKVKQLKRSAAGGRKKEKMEFAFASLVAPQSPMLMATYPAIPMSSASSPRLSADPAQLYHSPSSAFASVGRGQPAAASPQLPPAHPLGPYWPPVPLPSSQLFPQAPYPLPGLWGQPYPLPQAQFRGGLQQSTQQSVMAGQGFASPMTTLRLAAQPLQPIAQQTSAAPLLSPYSSLAAATVAQTTAAAMPAITLPPAQTMGAGQHANGVRHGSEEARATG